MKIKISKYTGTEALYLSALTLFLFRYVILFSSSLQNIIPGAIHNLFYLAIILLLASKAFYNSFCSKRGKKIILVTILILGLYIGFHIGEYNFIATVMLICLSYDIPFEKIICVTCFDLIIFVSVILSLTSVGILKDVMTIKAGKPRHTFGFNSTGTLEIYFLHIILMLLYIYKKKMNIIICFILITFTVVLNSICNIRGTYYLTMLTFFSFIIFIKFDRKIMFDLNSFFWKFISCIACPLCAVTSLILPLLYGLRVNDFLLKLNLVMTGRLAIAYNAILKYSLVPFGRYIQWVGSTAVASGAYSIAEYNYVDNGYLKIAIQYGVVFFMIVCIVYTLFFYHCVKIGNKMAVIWICIILIENFVYPTLITLSNNIIIVYAFSCILNRWRKRRLNDYLINKRGV